MKKNVRVEDGLILLKREDVIKIINDYASTYPGLDGVEQMADDVVSSINSFEGVSISEKLLEKLCLCSGYNECLKSRKEFCKHSILHEYIDQTSRPSKEKDSYDKFGECMIGKGCCPDGKEHTCYPIIQMLKEESRERRRDGK